MSFAHPSQHDHKLAGMKRALVSKGTPEHLKPHLARQVARLEGNMKRPINRVQQRGSTGLGGIPREKPILRAVDQSDRLNTSNPIDSESFEEGSDNSAVRQPGRVDPNAGAISAGGNNPNQRAASQKARTLTKPNASRTGPGIVHGESVVRKHHTGEGHNQTLAVERKRHPVTVSGVKRAGERGPGIQSGVRPNNTERWQRKGSANPAFYADWGM